MTEHDFSVGAHDYFVTFTIDDRDPNRGASFDGPFSVGRYEDDGSIVPVDFASFTPEERDELRRKMQAYAERDQDLRSAARYDDDADRDYDDGR